MNEERKQPDRDVIGELIRRAGRRENPSAEEYERVFAAASEALDSKLRARRRRFVGFGIAATLIAGIVVSIVATIRPVPQVIPVAELDRAVGPAEVAGPEAAGWRSIPEAGASLGAHTRIRTGPGSRLGLLLAHGVSLRMAEATEIALLGPRRIELVSGKIYVDAGPVAAAPAGRAPKIFVVTGDDTTWDVGTQFEVLYADDIYRLRVREGRVQVKQPTREFDGRAGEQLTIDAGQNLSRDRISGDDPEWQWTESVAPVPVIDELPVSLLLEWVSRQTGRKVEYADPGLELEARTTKLYGSVQFIEPLEALETMLATTDFDYTLLDDGTILVHSR